MLVALLSRTINFGPKAYVRIPGKSSKYEGKRGVNGSVPIGNLNTHKADMMAGVAGSIFSGMVDPNNKIAIDRDQKNYDRRLSEYAKEKGISV